MVGWAELVLALSKFLELGLGVGLRKELGLQGRAGQGLVPKSFDGQMEEQDQMRGEKALELLLILLEQSEVMN